MKNGDGVRMDGVDFLYISMIVFSFFDVHLCL